MLPAKLADISGVCHHFGRNRKWISGTSLKETCQALWTRVETNCYIFK